MTATEVGMSRRQLHILLVEDDAGDARRFRDMLESAAFEFELTHADAHTLDCQMPEMDGFQATRAIRQAEKEGAVANRKKGRIPIIGVTANAIKATGSADWRPEWMTTFQSRWRLFRSEAVRA